MGGDVYIVTSQYNTSKTCTTVNSHPHVHYIPQDGRTALMQASFRGHHKVVDLLTNAGAAGDVQDEVCLRNQKTAYYYQFSLSFVKISNGQHAFLYLSLTERKLPYTHIHTQ